jgi:transketolase
MPCVNSRGPMGVPIIAFILLTVSSVISDDSCSSLFTLFLSVTAQGVKLAPPARVRVGWERHVGITGEVLGMNTFGASAPPRELQHEFGFEPDRVVAAANEQLGR